MEHIERKKVYEGFLDFLEETIRHPSGELFTVNTLSTKASSVAILPRLPDGRFLLTREYRFPMQKRFLSPPGGRIDEGETPLEAAKRELFEETGYVSAEWTLLGSLFPYPAISDQEVFLALADNVAKAGAPTPDVLEHITPLILSPAEVKSTLATCRWVDGILPCLLTYAGM